MGEFSFVIGTGNLLSTMALHHFPPGQIGLATNKGSLKILVASVAQLQEVRHTILPSYTGISATADLRQS